MRAQGGVDRHNWRTCVVGLDAPSVCVRYITKMEKIQKFRFKANPNLRDVVKNQNQRMTPKINMDINHVHK